jgi:aspartate aminotransferase-like enzyme
MLLEEGLETAFARHAALGRACREGAKAMGLELFSPDEDRSAVVTAILTPDGVDAREGLSDRGHESSENRDSKFETRDSRIESSEGYYTLPRAAESNEAVS